MDKQQIKARVKDYWNQASCGTEFIAEHKFSPEYFHRIEQFRYAIEPEIFSFAQFTRYRGRKVLEVGVGAGTDFVQWVRAGASAYGIDLTEEALKNVETRLALEGLKATDLRVADAEALPFPDNYFDCAYSWGVIHHSPDTVRCLSELVRVTRPGGEIKIMIYHRRSLFAWYQYLKYALFKGKLFRSVADVLYHHQESFGTKAYTLREARAMIDRFPVRIVSMTAPATNHDLLYYHRSSVVRWCAYAACMVRGWHRSGWFMMIHLVKENS